MDDFSLFLPSSPKTEKALRNRTDDLENQLRLGNVKSVGLAEGMEVKADGILSHPFHFYIIF